MIAFMLTPSLSHLPRDVWARHHLSPKRLRPSAPSRDVEYDAVGVLEFAFEVALLLVAEIAVEAAAAAFDERLSSIWMPK